MERVTIVGCCGSGKTFLAQRMADRLSIPVVHLDTVFYDNNRSALEHDAFVALQKSMVAQSRWIIEGNYASTLPVRLAASDTVIVLDLPTVTCVRSVLQRRWRSGGDRQCGRGGDEAPAGTFAGVGAVTANGPASWGNSMYMLRYRRSVLPRIRSLITAHGTHADVLVLRSRRAVDRFLTEVRPSPTPHR